MLANGECYHKGSADFSAPKDPDRERRNAARRLQELGFAVELELGFAVELTAREAA